MHIKLISENTREAHLADKRLLITKDCGEAPDLYADLIFHRGHGEVWGFKLRETYGYETEVFTADRDKVEAESKACGHKTEAEKREWLDGIKKAESRLWQAWMDGDMYSVVIQEWDVAERKWKCIDCRYDLYGWEDVLQALKDMDLTGVEAFCVAEDCGDPKNWKENFREFDV